MNTNLHKKLSDVEFNVQRGQTCFLINEIVILQFSKESVLV